MCSQIDRKIIRRFCRKQSGQMQSEIQASSNIEIVRYDSINIVISIISVILSLHFQIYLDLDCNITEAIINWNRANGEFHLDVENDGKNKGKKIRDIVSVIIRSTYFESYSCVKRARGAHCSNTNSIDLLPDKNSRKIQFDRTDANELLGLQHDPQNRHRHRWKRFERIASNTYE